MSEHEPLAPDGAPTHSDSAVAPDRGVAEPASVSTDPPAATGMPRRASDPRAASPVPLLPDSSSRVPWEAGPSQAAPGALPRAALSVSTLAVVGFSLALTAQTAL